MIIRKRHLKNDHKFKSLYLKSEKEQPNLKYCGISKSLLKKHNSKYNIKKEILEAIAIPNDQEFIIKLLKEINQRKIFFY